MFIQVDRNPEPDLIDILINGTVYQVSAGISVAAALLQLGFKHNRQSLVSGSERGPYCMMGVCFECLVEINQVANQQACLTQVTGGMQIMSQQKERHIPLPAEQDSLAYNALEKAQKEQVNAN